jgi:hypothetical protein
VHCGSTLTQFPLNPIKHFEFSCEDTSSYKPAFCHVSCSLCRHVRLRWRCCSRHGASTGLLMFFDVLDPSPSSHAVQEIIMRVTPQQLSFTASAGTQCSPTRQSISTRLRRGPGQSRSSSSQSRVLDAVPDVVMTSGSRLRPAWTFWTVLDCTGRL